MDKVPFNEEDEIIHQNTCPPKKLSFFPLEERIVLTASSSDTIVLQPLNGHPYLIGGGAEGGYNNSSAFLDFVFTDPSSPAIASDFAGWVDWGDGSPASTHLTVTNGPLPDSFQLVATHTYAEEGNYQVSFRMYTAARPTQNPILIQGFLINTPQAKVNTVTSPVDVSEVPVDLASTGNFAFINGLAGSQVLATFTDPASTSEPITEYGANITWLPNSPNPVTTIATITQNGNIYSITDGTGHVMPADGVIKITVTHNSAISTINANIDVTTGPSDVLSITSIPTSLTSNEGSPTTFNLTFKDTNTATTASAFSASIQWGDGQTTNPTITGSNGTFTISAPHTYVDNLNNTIHVTINGPTGTTAVSGNTSITVNNVAPTANAGPDQTSNEGSSVSFSGTGTDPGINDTLTYSWTFGDGSFADGKNVTHTYVDNGTYTATLTVRDKDGAQTSDTALVTVNNVAPTANAGPDITSGELFFITFNGSRSDPSIIDTNSLTSLWNFGDGTTSTGNIATHKYADNGTYTATFTVTDKDGGQSTDSLIVTVTNKPPDIISGLTNLTSNEGDTLTFNVTVKDSTADLAAGLLYEWNFGDNTPTSTISGTNLSSVTHTYIDNGTYTVNLKITDKDGDVSLSSGIVTVKNVSPTPILGTFDRLGNEGQSLRFLGGETDPGIIDNVTLTWDFGDGSPTVTGSDVFHTYTDNGLYTATLTATDKDGGSNTVQFQMDIRNVAPIANAGPNQSVKEGILVTLSGSATDSGTVDASSLSYAWTILKNGNTYTTGMGSDMSFTPDDNGIYTANLTVTDKDGGVGSSSAIITADNIAPIIDPIPIQTADEGQTLTFNANITDIAADLPGLFYEWNFGDNIPTSSISGTNLSNVTHTYVDNGTYTVALRVTDKDGGVATTSTTVTVNNVAPTAILGTFDRFGNEGQSLRFLGGAIDPSIIDTDAGLSYTWTFGDGTTANGAEVFHTYSDNGIYSGSLTVTDKDGGTDTKEFVIDISNVAPTANAGPNQTVNESSSVTLTSTATDPGTIDAASLAYSWTILKNGNPYTTGTGNIINFTPDDNGIYTANLTVTDKDGAVGTSTAIITANNVAPTANAGPDQSGFVTKPITLTGSATDPSPIDTTAGLTYLWDFGDGSTSTAQSPTHNYTHSGTYAVTLTVTDKDGGVNTDTTIVTIQSLKLWGLNDKGDLFAIGDYHNAAQTLTDYGHLFFTKQINGTTMLQQIQNFDSFTVDANGIAYMVVNDGEINNVPGMTNVTGSAPVIVSIDLNHVSTTQPNVVTVLGYVKPTTQFGNQAVTALTFNPNNPGVLYAMIREGGNSTNEQLATLDISHITNGGITANLKGAITGPAGSITSDNGHAMKFDYSGNLYASDNKLDLLYQINPNTGAVIKIVDHQRDGLSNVDVTALAFDIETNTMLDFNSQKDTLGSLSLTDGTGSIYTSMSGSSTLKGILDDVIGLDFYI